MLGTVGSGGREDAMNSTVSLDEAMSLLCDGSTVILATCSGSGPALRPMTLQVLDGRFYMLTFQGSPKVDHIGRNPRCQIYADLKHGEDQGFIRLSCTPGIVSDPEVKAVLFSKARYARNFWESADDPRFCLLGFTPMGGDVLKPGEPYKRAISMDMG